MSYDLKITIEEGSAEARNLEETMHTQHVSLEEAARRLLAGAAPGRRKIIGAFADEPELVDGAFEIAMQERERRNAL
ncbi:MAG TPA: hypothetical protein VK934_07875 [Fimbriimonas sp.]|nr:hypothetical protein [Fimbriimonas sp.]